VLAAIGVAQLEQLEEFVLSKINVANYYRQTLKGIGDIQFQTVKTGIVSNEWLFTITTSRMSELLHFMKSNGIMCRQFWVPMNQLPMYRSCIYFNKNDVSAKVHRKALSLPCSTNITKLQLEEVTTKINFFFSR
jgi:perosamine synthetase